MTGQHYEIMFVSNKPFAFIRRRLWVEVAAEINTIDISVNITGAGYYVIITALPFIDLITLYPSSPY